MPMLLALAIAGLGGGCAGHDLVTLPADVQITHPSSDLPPSLAALPGRWDGRWAGSSILVLVVERIDRQSARVIYAYGGSAQFPPAVTRATAQVVGERGFVINFPSTVIHFELSGSVLSGESRRPDGTLISTITMTRFRSQPGLVTVLVKGPPGAEVSLDKRPGVPIGPDGVYRVTLSPGTYHVEVSRLGFEPWRERLELVRDQPRVERTVTLALGDRRR